MYLAEDEVIQLTIGTKPRVCGWAWICLGITGGVVADVILDTDEGEALQSVGLEHDVPTRR